ncbi:PepSY-associated TM helix domain-containing protein [Cupriavidus agavae]|uniref:Putative iron-regulated membrane protein n=1 Tax=Cupriavidus agavae TaxID=1001822 RepID=A0A4Q7RZQ6_9BURK|nr:PepSY-associated TM helix domain-containing protein [Cupriavidus agavae]RZT39345.1 putative iron-regulated membrane protein [Cupriavidus agavae]
MTGGFRQRMAWLHTWVGLWMGWLLFAVFLTGALSVFYEPITHWMQPERQTAARPAVDPQRALTHAQRLLALNAADAAQWSIELPGEEDYAVHLHYAGQRGPEIRMDPQTGALLPPARDTAGGRHFITFHYELHSGMVGVWIVAFFTMALLVAMVSGIVTHKRFFADFFTFRPRKGQRSWLDAHNALGVLVLPFLFVISYTGLVIWWPDTMPAGVRLFYADQRALFGELGGAHFREAAGPAPAARTLAVPDLPAMYADAQARLARDSHAEDRIDHVTITHPGRANAQVEFSGGHNYDGIDFVAAHHYHYDAASGAFRSAEYDDEMVGSGDAPVPLVAGSVLRSLHLARFGGAMVDWLYFVSGLAGAGVMATGLLLFSVKRRSRKLAEFGRHSARVYAGIDRLNVAAVAGLCVACIGYLWANRLLPVALDERHEWEIGAFFAIWAATALHAAACPPARAWRQQLGLAGLLCIGLPLLNALTTPWHLGRYVWHGDWRAAGVELGALACGAALLWTTAILRRRHGVGAPAAGMATGGRR